MRMTVSAEFEPSKLEDGWHPAFLIHIAEQETPAEWQMKTPTYWRWHFAIYDQKPEGEFEKRDGISSASFSPKSKAFQWVKGMLGQKLDVGQSVDLAPMFPIPCRVKTEINEQGFLKILDLDKAEFEASDDIKAVTAKMRSADGEPDDIEF